MADFLLEIGLEEVPARMIAGAEAELGRRVSDLLKRERLLAPEANIGAKVTTYSTPRRLAVLAEGVLAKQADTEEVLTGPSWKVAFKDGEPTPAAQAFAKKAGVAVAELKKVITPKGEYVGATVKRAGRTANEILAAELPKEVLAIYWAKNMYWRAGKPERFVRPVRWVVALLDSDVVPLEIAGIAAGNASRGHRVLHGEAPVTIAAASAYKEALRTAHVVVADVAERRQIIRKALDAATRTVPGARWREDEALVETVVHLTEWPTVILGDFEAEYLALPEEVLVTVMRDHQKYFAVEDANGKLAPHFLAVLNTQADAEGAAIIRHGNARVLRARFKDARFFWDVDQKTPLAERMESLKSVTFQKELGSYYWKTETELWRGKCVWRIILRPNQAATCFRLKQRSRGRESGQDRSDGRAGEGVHRVAGHHRRALRAGAGVGRNGALRRFTTSTRRPRLRTRFRQRSKARLLGLADRIQTIVAMFGYRQRADGLEGSVCAAPRSQRHCEDSGRIDLAAYFSVMLTDATRDLDHKTDDACSCVPRERLQFYLKDVRGFAYDVVNAVLLLSRRAFGLLALLTCATPLRGPRR